MAAQGDAEAADALRKLLSGRGVGEEGFARIVKAAGEITKNLRAQLAQNDKLDALRKRASSMHGPQEPAIPDIPQGARDDPPIPGGEPGGHQPTRFRPQQRSIAA